MVEVELTEDKRTKGINPEGRQVVATLPKGNRHPVAKLHDDFLVVIGASGARYWITWKGVRLVKKEVSTL